MKIQHTSMITGEYDHYQALANAVILYAIRDYRNASRMLHALRIKQRHRDRYDEAGLICLQDRIKRYCILREDAASFLSSDLFGTLCDLDGRALLRCLKKEAYQ